MEEMDLDRMKATWSDMGDQLKNKETTDERIRRMMQAKSGNKLYRIIYLELLLMGGAFFCAAFVLFHFGKFDSWTTRTGGAGTVLICAVSILIWGDFIRKARKIDVANNTYKQTLIDFAVCHQAYRTYKKLDYFLAFAVLLCIGPVVFKLSRDADLLSDVPFSVLFAYLAGGGAATALLLYLIYKFYDKNMRELKELLRQLEE